MAASIALAASTLAESMNLTNLSKSSVFKPVGVVFSSRIFWTRTKTLSTTLFSCFCLSVKCSASESSVTCKPPPRQGFSFDCWESCSLAFIKCTVPSLFVSGLFFQEEVGSEEGGEDYGDYAVHGEEGGVKAGKIVGLDERVFVEKKKDDGEQSGDGEFAEGEGRDHGDEQKEHDQVKGARDPEGAGDADVAGDGMEAGVAVEIEILAGVEDVEACDPEGDGGGEKKDAKVERAANGDPCGGGCDAEGESENEMRPASEAFGVGVKEQNGERDRREPEGEAIQLRRGEDEDGAGDDDERGDEGRRKMAGR